MYLKEFFRLASLCEVFGGIEISKVGKTVAGQAITIPLIYIASS